ncbi:MAG: NADH dehydrogenase (quinone) subunit D [Anaerolineales bacterium]|nr:MAG: NADH dehydrogenase (quinone) subunit D [Anaerolineales bacterium]
MSDTTFEKLRAQFPDAVLDVSEFRGDTTATITRETFLDVARFLRDEPDLQYDLLVDLTSIDRRDLGIEPRFVTVYELYSIPKNHSARLKVPLPWDNSTEMPQCPSVAAIWPTGNWHEREVYDLMGIGFTGHPWLHRILMPENWVGHPLRKDYPLGGEPVYFSSDRDNPRFAHLGKPIMEGPSYPSKLPDDVDSETHLVINVGPQHPATHGVLRLAVELDGERIVSVNPDIGYLHSGFEKTGENKRYEKFIPYTDRMDYLAAMNNNLAYVLTVEKLLEVEIPPRAQYIRVILAELQRIASHLFWIATHAHDVSGTIHSLLMYALRERERILDIFEMFCGARLTTSGMSVGGLRQDIPGAFPDAVRSFVSEFWKRLQDYEAMLTRNPIWLSRLKGVGILRAEDAVALGVTGPMLRAGGVPFDLRKAQPYSSYDHFDFDIPTATEADSYARYQVRMREMEQSLRIVEQAVNRLPEGPFCTDDRKVAPPPRSEIDLSMESLIHHFKLYTEGYKPPVGEVYGMAENPKGILGFFLVSDGTAIPYRLHVRGPSFVNLQATDLMARGHLLSDLITIIGTIDVVLGDVDR